MRFTFFLTLSAFLLNPLLAQTVIRSIETDEAVVALTFDDGPHATQTPRLLEFFAAEDIRVTFFEIGRNVAAHPELARAILEAGHEIGNHSKTHPMLGNIEDIAVVRAELVETQAIIEEATGFTPVIFRAPYLSHGPALWTVLDELQLPSIGASHSGRDWEAAVTKEDIIEASVKAGAGDIILLHTWPGKTADALPEIVSQLRAKGLRFVTVSELLALAKPSE
ncbi:MAG: polysaccharide deacetylase family protein [Puniceicoccaceae bacterium]|nr:MAG: polysaccharide deacetylase family protein [Puniceicoccaceae bacterium]